MATLLLDRLPMELTMIQHVWQPATMFIWTMLRMTDWLVRSTNFAVADLPAVPSSST